jgi:hypothetical protein
MAPFHLFNNSQVSRSMSVSHIYIYIYMWHLFICFSTANYHDQCLFHRHCLARQSPDMAPNGPVGAQTRAHHHGPIISLHHGPWALKRTQIDPKFGQNGPEWTQIEPKWAPRRGKVGPYWALRGARVSVEQTLIADSP